MSCDDQIFLSCVRGGVNGTLSLFGIAWPQKKMTITTKRVKRRDCGLNFTDGRSTQPGGVGTPWVRALDDCGFRESGSKCSDRSNQTKTEFERKLKEITAVSNLGTQA